MLSHLLPLPVLADSSAVDVGQNLLFQGLARHIELVVPVHGLRARFDTRRFLDGFRKSHDGIGDLDFQVPVQSTQVVQDAVQVEFAWEDDRGGPRGVFLVLGGNNWVWEVDTMVEILPHDTDVCSIVVHHVVVGEGPPCGGGGPGGSWGERERCSSPFRGFEKCESIFAFHIEVGVIGSIRPLLAAR